MGEDNSTTLITMNDDKVARYFWWALMKIKNKYNKHQSVPGDNDLSDSKLKILDDTSTILIDVLHTKDYILLYYPLDDAIRNKYYLV